MIRSKETKRCTLKFLLFAVINVVSQHRPISDVPCSVILQNDVWGNSIRTGVLAAFLNSGGGGASCVMNPHYSFEESE